MILPLGLGHSNYYADLMYATSADNIINPSYNDSGALPPCSRGTDYEVSGLRCLYNWSAS